MTATLLYRIAAVVLLLFAAGHTFGFLSFRPKSAEGLAVYNAMHSVPFDFNGAVTSTLASGCRSPPSWSSARSWRGTWAGSPQASPKPSGSWPGRSWWCSWQSLY